jgi:hypothetical protein
MPDPRAQVAFTRREVLDEFSKDVRDAGLSAAVLGARAHRCAAGACYAASVSPKSDQWAMAEPLPSSPQTRK